MANKKETELLVEQLTKNMDKFKNFVQSKIEEPRLSKFVQLINDLQDRIMLCPSNPRLEQSGCYEGGLVDNAIQTLSIMVKLRDIYKQYDEITAESLVVVSLFHDLGKIGNEAISYFRPIESDWHKSKLGQYYEIVPQSSYMAPCLRSLWWLNKYGIVLTEEEFYAISSLNKSAKEALAVVPINTSEPFLAIMLQQAVHTTTILNNKKISVL
jgi:hypothetical protein